MATGRPGLYDLPVDDSGDGFRPIYQLPELRELLFGASGRYHTARAAVRLTTNGKLMNEACRRQLDYEAKHGMIFHFYALDEDDEAADEDTVPEGDPLWYPFRWDSEEEARLWHERPNYWREETARPDGSVVYEVVNGRRHWQHYPPVAVNYYREDHREGSRWWPPLSLLLDPFVLGERLFESALVRLVGRGEQVGRETLEAEARIESRGHPPRGLSLSGCADSYAFSVDLRTGAVLRFAERLEGREFYLAEVREVAFDEEFPEGIFGPDPFGVGSPHADR